jgi:release factor glutamine methyltransferase
VTLAEALDASARRLADVGVPTPAVDAEWLAAETLGLTRTELALEARRELTGAEEEALSGLVERRATREPLAYILGEWGFRRLTLKVDRRVLIPRPETEQVVERCLELLRGLDAPLVLDVGTGSGVLARALEDERASARVTGVDVSDGALELARENAAATGLNVRFEPADVREGLTGRYDLVVSNPPYISAAELATLEPEVRDWEPHIATVGEEHTELIARAAREVLDPGGWLVLEIAAGAREATLDLLEDLGFEELRAGPDLAGRDRVVEGQWLASTRR